MPHDLASAQLFLVGALQHGSPIPDDPALAQASSAFITGNERLSPAEQVDIYRRQFWLRHRAVMGDDFPGLAHLLGESGMDAFCRAYLAAHPPASQSYRDMVRDIVRFTERHDGFASPEMRTLAVDMARYELGLLDIFVGERAPPLDPAKLEGMAEDAWERARIVLQPLLGRLSLSYPVHRLRKTWKGGESAPIPDAPAPVHLVLYRAKDLVTHFEELSPEAFALLEALAVGEPLVPACERVAADLSPEAQEALGESVGAWFQQWAALGWIVDVVL
jgi:hypothetical protein